MEMGTCLDGSPYGFYVGDSHPFGRMWPRTMLHNESWLLLFEGGGWCWSPEDCALRAESQQGSSKAWMRTDNVSIGGIVNRCCFCTKFCRFRRVYLKSCDGHSFAGDAHIDVPPSNQSGSAITLRSAGRQIIHSVVQVLIDRYDLARARNVLVGGCSAGGLTALLNAEVIRDQLRTAGARLERFKVVSLAGIFFQPSAGDSMSLAPFEEQMRAAVRLGNMTLPESCRVRMAVGQEWRCMLGLALVEALPADLPAFIYQSRLDLWQTNCVLAAGRSRYFGLHCSSGHWRPCLGWMAHLRSSSNCAPEQWAALRAYEEANDAALAQSPALRRPGYGSFVHSCYDHCPSTYALINTGATLYPGMVNDSINVRESLHAWFKDMANDKVPAWNHTHTGCWNGLVASKVPGKSAPLHCRRPECGPPDKMHHDDTEHVKRTIAQRGWSLDPP